MKTKVLKVKDWKICRKAQFIKLPGTAEIIIRLNDNKTFSKGSAVLTMIGFGVIINFCDDLIHVEIEIDKSMFTFEVNALLYIKIESEYDIKN